jgi:SMODS and SLOG-associating 2TM effector domain 2
VAMDRFFGFSTAWMRYMATEIAIHQAVTNMQFDWATTLIERGSGRVTPEEATALLAKLADAAAGVEDLVARETVAWADEFQNNIGELRSLATQTPT